MKFEWFVALRYFKSNRKDNSFLSFIKVMAITGVAIGSAGLLIALSIVHGFKSVIEDKILGFGTHITIETYADMPVYRADTLVTWLENHPDIDRAQAVIQGQGMIQMGAGVEGTFIKGVPVEGDLSDLRNYITTGIYDLTRQESGLPGIVMGARLARNLQAEVGQAVFLYAIIGQPSASNLPEIQQFQLTGVYQTGIDRFDDVLVIVPIESARRLFGLSSPTASMVDVRVNSTGKIREVAAWMRENLDFPYYSTSLYTRYSNIFAWIRLQEVMIPFVISVMVFVGAFNLIGAVLMMVLERVRDIGTLKLLGAENNVVRKIFLLEGFFVGVLGLILGIGIAVLFNWLQAEYALIPLSEENYYMSTAPVEPHLLDFIIVTVVTLSLCVLASLIPAHVASKLRALDVVAFGK